MWAVGNPERENRMSARLYVGNLPFSVTQETLRTAFAPSGGVTDVHILMDRETGRSRGFGGGGSGDGRANRW